jgi:hypothetical protein
MTLEKVGLLQQKPVLMLNRPSTMPASEGGGPSSSAGVPTGSPFAEKRREKRYSTCEAVEVCLLDMHSQGLQGILRDVSRSGLRIELNFAVKAGARLEVVLRDRAIIFGEARYCRRSAHTYQVGVAIEDIYYPKSVLSESTDNERRKRNSPRPIGMQPGLDRGPAIDGSETPGPDRRHQAQTVFLRCPIAQRLTGGHVSPDDVAAFLHRNLSETKTALVERHLATCEECSTLTRTILEDYTSFVTRFGNDTTRVQSAFGRVTLKDPGALS